MSEEPSAIKQHSRLGMLDILRFGAAVAVVIYHFTYNRAEAPGLFSVLAPVSRFGYMGVDLFFMLSGFVILWSALGRSAGEFVVSRIARLYPSFWCAIILTTVALQFIKPENVRPLWALFANATMLPRYLGAAEQMVDSVYWTLAVELRFYVLILVLLLLRQSLRVERWLGLWLAALVACFCLHPLAEGRARTLLHVVETVVMYPYGAHFIAGCLFFLVWRHGLKRSSGVALLACLGCSVVTAVTAAPSFLREDSSALNMTAGLVMVSIYALFAAIALGRLRNVSPRWAALGAITYPLYLIHNEIGQSFFVWLGPGINEWLRLGIVSAAIAVAAWLMTVLVERRACPWLRRKLTAALLRRPGTASNA